MPTIQHFTIVHMQTTTLREKGNKEERESF